MTYDEIKQFVADHIRYKDWEFHVKVKPAECGEDLGCVVRNEAIYLQVQFTTKSPIPTNSGYIDERQYCRKWQLSTFMTPTEIVRTCWLAVKQAEEHEAAEKFLFDGLAIYNPHIDVEELKNASTRHDVRRDR